MGKSGKGKNDGGLPEKAKAASEGATASTEKPTQQLKAGISGNEEAGANKRKKASEIEDIFNAAKLRKASAPPLGEKRPASADEGDKPSSSRKGKDAAGVGDKAKKVNKAKKVPGVAQDEETFVAPGKDVKRRKRTGDGLAVYTEEEIGFGRKDAGGTPDCPFDCNCCF